MGNAQQVAMNNQPDPKDQHAPIDSESFSSWIAELAELLGAGGIF